MAESPLHLKLKRCACRWLWDQGYAAIAEEVKVPGLGVIDVAAAGRWRRLDRRRPSFDREPAIERRHVVFIECKAMRADFLRDQGRQRQFAFALAEEAARRRSGRRAAPRHAAPSLGKFDSCLLRPHANLHYLLIAPDVLRAGEIPRRWGLLILQDFGVRVARRATWQEVSRTEGMESAIAAALTRQRMLRPASDERRAAPPEHDAGDRGCDASPTSTLRADPSGATDPG